MSRVEQLIIVDEFDKEINSGEKMAVHRQGLRHRAFSIFVYRNTQQPEILLQQRAWSKYHSKGLWSNTCCGHPNLGEDTKQAAERRLFEEMGFTLPLRHIGVFEYKAKLENELMEHEIDHVFIAEYGGEEILPSPNEVIDYRWVRIPAVLNKLASEAQAFTAWFKPALEVLLPNLQA